MANLREELKKLKDLHAAYGEKAATLTSQQISEEMVKFKEARAAIQAILTEGAKDCEAVEGGEPHRPIGIFHEGTANPFEIGDPLTRNRRVRAAFLEDAVEKWNNGEYLPPRDEGTVTGTVTDASGNVKSTHTAKIKR